MGELRISLLGPFRASIGERPLGPFRTNKVQALLIYVVVEALSEPAALHSRESLMDLLWPDLPVKSARDNLRQTLYQLRKAIPSQQAGAGAQPIELLLSNRLSVGLNPDYRYSLDVADFLRYLLLDRLDEAIVLYRGDFLADFFLPGSNEFESWATALRSRFQGQVLDALDTLIVKYLEQCWLGHAERYARRLLEIDDLQEPAYRYLMEVLARSGKRSAALEVYSICRQRLNEELGIEPGQGTMDLLQLIEADQIQVGGVGIKATIKGAVPLVRDANSCQEKMEDFVPNFVERKRELACLAEALEEAYAGRGQLRFVIGGSGRGKTALVSEFAQRALSKNPELLVAAGYCRGQNGYGDLYNPFREALAQITGDVGGVLFSLEHARRLKAAMPLVVPPLLIRAPDLIDSLIPGDDLRKRAASFARLGSGWFQQLCARLDAPYRDNLRQERLFSQVTAYLRDIAAEYPLMLILEDLHLADPTSVALIFHLSRDLTDWPIFLLGTYRPDELVPLRDQDAHPLAAITGELKRQYGDIWLDLGGMTEAEGRTFVNAYIDKEPNCLDEAFRSSLFNHTSGHALFTVELLRAMQERGDLVQDEDGRWLAGVEIDWHTLPAKVEGVIEQRLGRLDTELQSALTVASVEGEVFTAEVVAKIQKEEKGKIVRRLSREVEKQHRLVEAEGLTTVRDHRLSCYRFRHQLFQQYLYQNLDEMERAYLHEEVGRTLEGLYGLDSEEAAARLAWHFDRAGLAEIAVDHLTLAARQAMRLGANDQVIEHCKRGLALLETRSGSDQDAQRELTLETMLGITFIAARGYGSMEAGAAFKRAQELYQQVGQTPQLFPVLFGLWGYYVHRVDYKLAHELAGQALNLARQQQELGPLLMAHKMMGITLFFMGEFAMSLEHLEQIINDYDPETHGVLGFVFGSDPCLSALSTAALILMCMGYPDRALTYIQRALQLARDLSYPFALAFVLLYELWLHTVRITPQDVLEHVEQQIELTSEHGFPMQLAMAKYYKHWALGMSRAEEKPLIHMHSAMADWEATGSQLGKTAVLGGFAQVCLEAGRIEDGLSYSASAIEQIEKTGERFYQPDQFRIRGELLMERGNADREAETSFQQAIEIARMQKARLPELRATTSLCRLWRRQDRKEKARQALAEIYNWFDGGFEEPALLAARHLLQTLSS